MKIHFHKVLRLKIFVMFCQLRFGLLSTNRKLWTEMFVDSVSYKIRELIPGSDYGVSLQSVLGPDTSRAANRDFSTRKIHNRNAAQILMLVQSDYKSVRSYRPSRIVLPSRE